MSNHRFGARKVKAPVETEKTTKIVAQHNNLIEASYTVSVDEKRLLQLAKTKINFQQTPRWGNIEVDFTVDEWKDIYPGAHGKAYSDIKKACSTLMKRQVKVRQKEGSRVEEVFNWVDSCLYMPKEGRIRIRFGSTCSDYLTALTRERGGDFTLTDIRKLAPLRTFYSIRLYELLQKWSDRGTVYRTVEELKQIFELGDAYRKFYDFERRVLDPAVKEINQHTESNVTYEVKYKGRIAHQIIFEFEKQKRLKFIEDESPDDQLDIDDEP